MLKKTFAALALGTALLGAGQVMAADYAIDKKDQHAFINFKISHVGFSYIYGTFKDWDGDMTFDAAKPEDSKISVVLQTASVDTNHAERDKHIRTPDFLDVAKFPTATFKSTAVKSTGADTADVTGNLTLHGVTKPIVIAAHFIHEGVDPWGATRAGFEGTSKIVLKDFDIKKDLGPASASLELVFSFDAIKKEEKK